ncbi:hypothetical protein SRB5_13320 [Streptomyces sp. RB5]|uniref:Activator of Hsp90 ATPase homologue 1/2-like C-terminal domain-containing protein n=1 Tax=Streptomyces smaragdinus TaxID=2585196 RepID=A0A7K0CCM0_9ACTN|nr:SRPBCC domain-containing protein [Streptomyces smaragdinus]MQY11217.1 hypothetical protein [Streptomyces smaragdinus]
MEYGSIEREIHVDATPEVVFDVVSRPEHIREWWTDDASFEPVAGGGGELVFGDREIVQAMTVVTVEPPRLFAFRWCYPDGTADELADSLLVTIELVPEGGGTTVKLTETGFREMGWEEAKVAAEHKDHSAGWSVFVPRLGEYAGRLAAAS